MVAKLEEAAALPLTPDSTDVTDRTDPVFEDLASWLRGDSDARMEDARGKDPCIEDTRIELIRVLNEHTDPTVRTWLRSVLLPSVVGGVEVPEPVYDQPGVPVDGDDVSFRAAVTLGLDPGEFWTAKDKRKAKSKPWKLRSSWFHGRPRMSTTLTEWPRGRRGIPLQFLLQVGLKSIEDNVSSWNFFQVGLPKRGHLQFFADLDTIADDGRVDHRVVYIPKGGMLKSLLEPPVDAGPIEPPVFINDDTAPTLPHEHDVPVDMDELDRFDYRVLKAVLDMDPYDRNMFSDLEWDEDEPSPLERGYRPVVPVARLGGYPLIPVSEWLEDAVRSLDCDPGDIFLLLDMPLQPSDEPTEHPNRERVMVLTTKTGVEPGDLSSTYARAYTGPNDPPIAPLDLNCDE